MKIYRDLEEEYLLAIDHGVADTPEDRDKLVGFVLSHNPHTTPEVSTNVRLYFEAAGTLKGLAEWYAAINDSTENN